MEQTRPEHLQVQESPRGFAAFPPVLDEYEQDQVQVYESSNAEGPHLWIKGVDVAVGSTRVELTAVDAWRFAEQIMTAVANHYQGDARPDRGDRVADLSAEVWQRLAGAAYVADTVDVSGWQRGYRACSERVLSLLADLKGV